MAPTRRLLRWMLVGLAVAAVPVLVPATWPLYVAYLGALLLLAAADTLVVGLGDVAVAVEVPATAGVGNQLELCVETTRTGPGARGRILAEFTGPLTASPAARVQLPRGTSLHDLSATASERGRGALEAIWIELEGPVGLVVRRRRAPVEDASIAVVPSTDRLRRFALKNLGSSLLRAGQRAQWRHGEGTEIDALTAYVPGMDLRHVDWKSSARHNALRVWRHKHEAHQNVVLCIDTGRLMSVPMAGALRLDHAVHAALLLSEWALRQRDLVAVHAYGAAPRAWLPAASGLRHAARIAQTLAGVTAEPSETNHVLGLHAVLSKQRRRSLVVVFTDFVDSTTAELMIEHLGHMAARHVVVFVAMDDPALEGPFEQEPASLERVATAVLASDMARAREAVFERLRHRGVQVVHGPPGRVALDLLARYLELKRRGAVG